MSLRLMPMIPVCVARLSVRLKQNIKVLHLRTALRCAADSGHCHDGSTGVQGVLLHVCAADVVLCGGQRHNGGHRC